MKVIRSDFMGFCMGVRRAVEMARNVPCNGSGVYTLGPLIHNPRALESLEKRGIGILKEAEISSIPENSTVIIRAHGISPGLERDLVKRGARIIDATCPHVKRSQEKARSYAEKGWRVFLAGEKDHAEIAGMLGYIGEGGVVAASPAEAEKEARELSRTEKGAKTVLLGQTTVRREEYLAVAEAIKKYFPGLLVLDTICGATAERQDALRELCGRVDALVIAGGRDSANTRRLLSLAVELGKPAWIAESGGDLPPEAADFETVGLCAGASTPDELITEIEEVLTSFRIEQLPPFV
jgi:4-hydroxy-3-methylbut-2-enyl diphosphate reductase